MRKVESTRHLWGEGVLVGEREREGGKGQTGYDYR